jgi:hypothetical protein
MDRHPLLLSPQPGKYTDFTGKRVYGCHVRFRRDPGMIDMTGIPP